VTAGERSQVSRPANARIIRAEGAVVSALLAREVVSDSPLLPLAGFRLEVWKFVDRIEVVFVLFGAGLREESYHVADYPPGDLAAAVADAAELAPAFAAGGKGGAR
jgi:hypothetical protein